MLSPQLKLNPKLFDADILRLPIRKGFGEGLLAAGEADGRVVGLSADLTESTQMHLFRQKFPERFVEIGVAEQNLASVASGLAASGKIPFISSYAVFSPGRNWEQIRTTICYNNVPVKIAGSHAGVSVGPDGGSHQALEDIALARVLPRMTVLSPCDTFEAKKATIAAALIPGPVYIRLAREKTPVVTTEETPFEVGKASVFFRPIVGKPEAGIIATGSLVWEALLAARELEKEKIGVTVLNLATIKPLDEKEIVALARSAGRIITVEEHQIAGGMGSAVAECLARNYPVPVEFVGVADCFGQSGRPEELIAHYRLDSRSIAAAVKKLIKRK
jgi:transketolase